MSATDDVRTLGRSRLSFATQADLDEFVQTLDAFENGRLGPDQWRGFRLVRGLYGQRQEDLHMIRVKVPQGMLTESNSARWPKSSSGTRAASAISRRARTSSSTSCNCTMPSERSTRLAATV